jgi:hypothetical protein
MRRHTMRRRTMVRTIGWTDQDCEPGSTREAFLVGKWADVEPFLDQHGKPFEAGALIRLTIVADEEYDDCGNVERAVLRVERAENIDPIGYYDSIDLGSAWIQRHRAFLMDFVLWLMSVWADAGEPWPSAVIFTGDAGASAA